jgi:hypothetical protein
MFDPVGQIIDFIRQHMSAQGDPSFRNAHGDSPGVGNHPPNGRPDTVVQDLILRLIVPEPRAQLDGRADCPIPGITRCGCEPVAEPVADVHALIPQK